MPIFLFACALGAQEIVVEGDKVWTGTNLEIEAGETIRLSGSGALEYTGSKGEKQTAGAAGLRRGFKDMLKTLPVNASEKRCPSR